MDDVVAVAVETESGDRRYFVTWGRIQDPVNAAPLERLVLEYSRSCGLGGSPVRAQLCASLREAANEPYFYEALIEFAGERQRTRSYERWRRRRAREMEAGREIYYLGQP